MSSGVPMKKWSLSSRAEDPLDVACRGFEDGGEVGRDGLDRARFVLARMEHEHRRDLQRAEGQPTGVHLGGEGVAGRRRLADQIGVDGVQGDVGDQSEKTAAAGAFDDHVAADGQVFDGELRVEVDEQAARERTADDHAQRGFAGARAEVGVEGWSVGHGASNGERSAGFAGPSSPPPAQR